MEGKTTATKYEPQQIEPKWQRDWIAQNLFHADEHSKKPAYAIVIPPPNVTGSLHLGHALNNTLQDILCRFKRMTGFEVLWMPGTDHAGIATQNVVERQLAEQKLTRKELGREKFLERVWQWKETSGGQIVEQLKRLGCSCDWERERFTMDEGLSRAVRETFVRLFQEGLIYRGAYIINWCTRCESALADLEVEYPDEPEKGHIYRLRYSLVDPEPNGPKTIDVETTRPETMLGDTAVAVHPDDERYKRLIGKSLSLPIVGRVIPIIADPFVDPAFGTGAVKITPGHDPNDFEAARRNNLPTVTVIDSRGKMTNEAGKYAGLESAKCREQILTDLKEGGVLVESKAHELKTGRCYRCQTVIEPLVSTQWFVRMNELAERAADAVRRGDTQVLPKAWEGTYFQWLENIRDWCISRQLWWGHQIPVWYCEECTHLTSSVIDPTECGGCGSKRIRQDEDVLDTWFSSALWPFSTMGWPEKNDTLEKFYPTNVLVTGFDILFFWVARMMMMGLKMTDQVPFSQIYLHAMVRDEHGQKMSKSKGNVIDPLVIINEFGADALRFTLAIMTMQGRDVNLAPARIAGYRNFLNKVWNAQRFVLITIEGRKGGGFAPSIRSKDDLPNDIAARWIRARLAQAVQASLEAYEAYEFSEICSTSYRFVWDELCSWYLEIVKLQLRGLSPESSPADAEEERKILNHLVMLSDVSLRLLHPVVPFVTEELWRELPQINGKERGYIIQTNFPSADEFGVVTLDTEAEEQFALLQGIVTAVRTIRSEGNIPPSQAVDVVLRGNGDELEGIRACSDLLRGLARIGELSFGGELSGLKTQIVSSVTVGVSVPELPRSAEDEKRTQKERERLEKEIARITQKLSSDSFLQNAPSEVVEKERKKLKEFEDKLAVIS